MSNTLKVRLASPSANTFTAWSLLLKTENEERGDKSEKDSIIDLF